MWAYIKWQSGEACFPSTFKEAKNAETAYFKQMLQPQTREEAEETSATLLRKKWSRDWNGSQSEGLNVECLQPPG
eukprot:8667798-Karenia_brevis.AAC.1